MKPIITQGNTIDNSGGLQPDIFSMPDQTMTDPGAGVTRPPIATWSRPELSAPPGPGPAIAGEEADQPLHTVTSSAEIGPAQAAVASAQSGLVINVSFDSSVTSLQTSNMMLFNEYTNAAQAAVQFFESEITNPITVNINFGWGEAGGNPIAPGASGQSTSLFLVHVRAAPRGGAGHGHDIDGADHRRFNAARHGHHQRRNVSGQHGGTKSPRTGGREHR
jgi:hypothetical protein